MSLNIILNLNSSAQRFVSTAAFSLRIPNSNFFLNVCRESRQLLLPATSIAARNYTNYTKPNSKSHSYSHNKRFTQMITIRYNEKTEKIAVALKCTVFNHEREFTLNRDLDEELGSTLQRLHASYTKHLSTVLHKMNKRLKKSEPDSENAPMDANTLANTGADSLPLSLFDLENNLVPPTTKNRDAWKENYTFKFNEQSYKVIVNLPAIKKLSLSKVLIAGMSAIVKVEVEPESNFDEVNTFSHFSWFASADAFDSNGNVKFVMPSFESLNKLEWRMLGEGVNKKMHVLQKDCENKLIKGINKFCVYT